MDVPDAFSDSDGDEAREAGDRFRSLVENLPDVVARLDSNLRHLYVSPALERLAGVPASEIVGRDYDELEARVEGDLVKRWRETARRALRTGRPAKLRFTMDLEGRQRTIDATYAPERADAGKDPTLLVVARDVTQEAEALAALQATSERRKALLAIQEHVLEGEPEAELLQTAVDVLLPRFEADAVLLHQVGPDGDTLEVVAQAGIPPGTPDLDVPVADHRDALARVHRDLRARRWGGDEPTLDHASGLAALALRSGMAVPLPGARGCHGVLSVHTRAHRAWSDDDVAFLRTVGNVLGEAIDDLATRRELQASRDRHEAYLEAASDAIFTMDPDSGAFTRVNGAFTELTGWTWDEARQRTFQELVHPDDAAEVAEALARTLAGEEVPPTEVRARVADGPYRTFSVVGRPVRSGGEVVDYFVIARDVEEVRRAQEALRDERDLVRSILDASPVGIAMMDSDGRYRFANARGLDILGLRGNVEGYTWTTAPFQLLDLRGEPLPWHGWPSARALRGGEEVRDAEVLLRRQDGTRRRLMVNAVPLRDDAGAVERAVFAFVDVTATHEAQTRREESERRYRTLVGSVPDLVAELDADHRLVFANAALLRLLERDLPEIQGQPLEAMGVPPGVLDTWFSAMDEVLSLWEPRTVESDLEVGGDERTFQIIFAPDEAAGTARETVLAVARDVTPLKRTERRLEEQARVLRQRNSQLQDLTNASAHELQEPLRDIHRYLQRLERRVGEELGEDARGDLAMALRGAERLETFVGGLQIYLGIEPRPQDASPHDVGELVDLAVEGLEDEIRTAGATVTRDPGSPTASVVPEHMHRVLRELLRNAILFHEDAPPEVHVGFEERDDGTLVVSVRDRGLGIDPRYHERVFRTFQRLQPRGAFPGVGMGLPICRRIVEGYGGAIWLRSEPGAGSTFYFTIPSPDDDVIP